MIKPDAYFEKITDIKINFFEEKNIKAVILDVDNTLMDLDRNLLNNIEEWIENLKKANIKICIASNSIKKEKIKKIADKIEVPYVFFSIKPFKRGLKKAIKILQEEKENIAEIGDQYFTDVIGSKRMKLFSILTKPISGEKNKLGEFKRKIEKRVLKKLNIDLLSTK